MNFIKKHRTTIISFCAVATMLTMVGIYLRIQNEAVTVFAMPSNQRIVVIDAGHGGWDPGATRSGILEKDINLAIAENLQAFLEVGGAQVILTRTSDDALGVTKSSDMYNRRRIAEESNADIFISIHQNSYPNPSVRGAQAFYYGDSERAKLLAELIQEQFATFLDRNNKRPATANQNYYVLKQIPIPSVLVETGYLTNPNESRLLTTEEHQQKIAWAIYMGILNYFAQISMPQD